MIYQLIKKKSQENFLKNFPQFFPLQISFWGKWLCTNKKVSTKNIKKKSYKPVFEEMILQR